LKREVKYNSIMKNEAGCSFKNLKKMRRLLI